MKEMKEMTAEDMLKLMKMDEDDVGLTEKELMAKHKFWDTQPVPSLRERVEELGPIDEPKTVEDVRQNPYNLPKGFCWVDLDVDDEHDLEQMYKLLTENYVEDDDSTFRFDYSPDFLRWALTPPGFRQEWHIGVRVEKSGKLYGMITGIPAMIQVHGETISMVEINFLCVHKDLRTKRLAPVLIKEVTRRVNLRDIWQATFTAGVVLPKPVSRNRYWHRSLNALKLADVGFAHIPPRLTRKLFAKKYKLPAEPKTAGFRPLEEADIPTVLELLNNRLSQQKLAQVFDKEEAAHWLIPREGVIYSYVVENKDGVVTDFTSFYALPSSISGHSKYNDIKAAYSYYNVATETDFTALIKDAMIMAAGMGFDVYNCLDLNDNQEMLKPLLFGKGDGTLQYYLYNWKCPLMQPEEMGLVLL
eukprot:TRINITY_DN668_c0_g2_i1.p1 TRINITY_DN668_c0_g2~~TRINITY_DN668_c0_g2_i1.p1  ORF type:complete len:416 (+),score=150.46 TRINITY_DN668_c0_g2_i1:690-1937(+)